MSKNKNIIRRQLGYQLGLLRIEQRKSLHHVAKANNISPYTLDQLEMGMNKNWNKYFALLEYYQYEPQLILARKE